jgi:hypothetical protein
MFQQGGKTTTNATVRKMHLTFESSWGEGGGGERDHCQTDVEGFEWESVGRKKQKPGTGSNDGGVAQGWRWHSPI